METHANASDYLWHLPPVFKFTNVATYADGGTTVLYSEISDGVTVTISLSPTDSTIFQGQRGQLYLSEYGEAVKNARRFLVVPRSDLETQILSILKASESINSHVEQWRLELIAFLESDKYLLLHAKKSGNK
ncbi:MAG: hypothetical protein JNK76_05360 [Planctomycetales bacterium]|nr:hypothetical protein [Planctomycetales bacterium]MBN8627824.1 hypothetical protein [Planctomycetota bacterium]